MHFIFLNLVLNGPTFRFSLDGWKMKVNPSVMRVVMSGISCDFFYFPINTRLDPV